MPAAEAQPEEATASWPDSPLGSSGWPSEKQAGYRAPRAFEEATDAACADVGDGGEACNESRGVPVTPSPLPARREKQQQQPQQQQQARRRQQPHDTKGGARGAAPAAAVEEADEIDDEDSEFDAFLDDLNSPLRCAHARPPLRQLGLLEIEPLRSVRWLGETRDKRKGNDAFPVARLDEMNEAEQSALSWARTREMQPANHGGEGSDTPRRRAIRGGVLVHARDWHAEAIVSALVASEYLASKPPPAAPPPQQPPQQPPHRARATPRTLLVCTTPTVEALERQLSRDRVPFLRFEGSASKRRSVMSSGCPAVIATYGLLIAKESRPFIDAASVGGMPGWRVRQGAATAEQKQLRSYLHSVRWRRVVFFDAHAASNPSTQRAQAAAALCAEIRWAVSGPTAPGRAQSHSTTRKGAGGVGGGGPVPARSKNGTAAAGAQAADASSLLALLGVDAASGWRKSDALALIRDPRGDLATLAARGYALRAPFDDDAPPSPHSFGSDCGHELSDDPIEDDDLFD